MPWKPPRHRPVRHRKEPRPTACKRGLDRRHRKMRDQELREQPLCIYCLQKGLVVAADTIDHVIPTSRGGATHDPDNRVSACKACNIAKGATMRDTQQSEEDEIEAAEAAGAALDALPPQGGVSSLAP